jgi:hypothetical protein
VQNFDVLEGVAYTGKLIFEAKQNVNLDLADNFAENCDDSGQHKNNILPTPEASQTQYFGDSRLDFRPLGNRHRKSSTLDYNKNQVIFSVVTLDFRSSDNMN